MTLYVGNLSFDAEQEDLRHLFTEYGEVKSCSLPLDRETGRKRGFAFVELVNEADEQKAIDDLQDVEWMGRMIRVNKAEPRTGGGGGGGRPGGGGGGSPSSRVITQAPRFTGEVEVPLAVTFKMAPCVRRPPRGEPAGRGTGRTPEPLTGGSP